MTILLILVLALIPSLFWLFIFLRKDDYEPEPLKLLLKIFFVGILFSLPVSYIHDFASRYISADSTGLISTAWQSLLFYLLLVAPIEEGVKFFSARAVISGKNKKYFTQVVDGIVYMVVAAAAFTFVEDFVYFLNDVRLSEAIGYSSAFVRRDLIDIFGTRFLGGPLHLAASGVLGYFWGLSWFKKEDSERLKPLLIGFGFAVVLHALFDFAFDLSGLSGVEFGLFALPLAVIGTVFVIHKFAFKKNVLVHEVPGGTVVTEPVSPRATTVLKIIIPALLLIAAFMFTSATNQRTGDNNVYSVVMINGGEVAVLVQTEGKQQCEVVRGQSTEFYAEFFEDVASRCDGSAEFDDVFSPIFAMEPVEIPYLQYLDWRGHETRVVVLGEFTNEERANILQIFQSTLERDLKGQTEIELVAPRR